MTARPSPERPARGLGVLPMASPFAAASRDLALLALFGIGQFGAGFLLFTVGARLIPVAETALIAMLEVVLGPLWVWLVIGEAIGVRAMIGGLVILGALVIHPIFDLAPSARPSS